MRSGGRVARTRCGYARAVVLVLAVFALALPACRQGPVEVGTSPVPPSPSATLREEPLAKDMVNKIAYVGNSGDLFTVDPDGGNRVNLTGGTRLDTATPGGVLAGALEANNYYFWPTWSHDGSRLAASRINTSGAAPEVTVEIFDMVNGGVRTVYQNRMPSLIAEGAPHYLYWSPDGGHLAFLVSSPEAFALMVADVRDSGGGELSSPELVETGAPLYFHWGQGGNEILLHTRDELKMAARPFDTGSSSLLTVGQGFRAAALSPTGGRIAYTALNNDGSGVSLFVAETGDPDASAAILDVGPLSAFAWSPDGSDLAVLEGRRGAEPGTQRLVVLPAQGGSARTLAEEAVIAFFWSPAGDRIAWVTADREDGLLEWKVSPADEADPQRLFRFHPTGDMRTMLTFFDQYAYSHSPWSPDGTSLVVAGTRAEPFTRRNGGSPRGERVFVLDASGGAEPVELAEGSLGVWSWN